MEMYFKQINNKTKEAHKARFVFAKASDIVKFVKDVADKPLYDNVKVITGLFGRKDFMKNEFSFKYNGDTFIFLYAKDKGRILGMEDMPDLFDELTDYIADELAKDFASNIDRLLEELLDTEKKVSEIKREQAKEQTEAQEKHCKCNGHSNPSHTCHCHEKTAPVQSEVKATEPKTMHLEDAAHHIPVVGDVYRHFSGKLYEIKAIARKARSNELMVVYRALQEDFEVVCCPLNDFIVQINPQKHPNAKQAFRFEYVTSM